MPENLKFTIVGTVLALAAFGFLHMKREFSPVANVPKPSIPEPIKLDEAREKVSLLVRSDMEQPIRDVTVEFAVSNGSSVTKRTDSSGYTDIEIPRGIDTIIYLKHKDYVSEKYKINPNVDPGKTKEYTLKGKVKANSPFTLTPPVSESSNPLSSNDSIASQQGGYVATQKNKPLPSQRDKPLPSRKPTKLPAQVSQPPSVECSGDQIMGDNGVAKNQVCGYGNLIQNNVNIGN